MNTQAIPPLFLFFVVLLDPGRGGVSVRQLLCPEAIMEPRSGKIREAYSFAISSSAICL